MKILSYNIRYEWNQDFICNNPIVKYMVLVLVALALILWLMPNWWGQRLDSCLGDCAKTYPYQVGNYDVSLVVTAKVQGDNGPADITVSVNGKIAELIASHFNYDTLTDIPVGYTHRAWLDDDLYRDLVIATYNPISGRYRNQAYIGSQSGQLHNLR